MHNYNKIILFILAISILFCTGASDSLDTDGDGYSDKIEEELGTDPNNKEDRYYYGYWPYNSKKDLILGTHLPISCPNNIGCECVNNSDCPNSNCKSTVRGEKYCTPNNGDPFPNFIAVDQYGEYVDIYDFANQGKKIIIEVGAAWCRPCQQLASWLSNGDNTIESSPRWKKEYSVIRDMVNKEEIIFITILVQNSLRESMTYEDVFSWHENYPNHKIPVLADEYKDVHQWIKPYGYPCINLLDENMKFISFSQRGWEAAFDILTRGKIKKD